MELQTVNKGDDRFVMGRMCIFGGSIHTCGMSKCVMKGCKGSVRLREKKGKHVREWVPRPIVECPCLRSLKWP